MESMNLVYIVIENITINDILEKKLFISARLRNKLIKSKSILLNNIFTDTRTIAHSGDILNIILDLPEDNSNIISKQIPLDIIYEDAHMLAINKPAGIAVHPSILHFEDSLANGVKFYFDSIGLKKKIRAVNRIDCNTSGLVLFAKNEYIQECLIKQMANKTFCKTYLAIVSGHMAQNKGIINAPIARKENSIIERCVSPLGQIAITKYNVVKEFKNYSLVSCTLDTGRTHQIRVHMAFSGNPILGDSLYGNKEPSFISRQALHSYKMDFIHPIYNKPLQFKADLPKDMEKLLQEE